HECTNFDHLRAVFCVETLTESAVEILSSALAAISELKQKRVSTAYRIVVVAESLEDNALEMLRSVIAEKELSDSVGVFDSRSDMPELWHYSDIALMISNEDLSVSTGIGAMMAGVSLLCAANNPCSEIIEDGMTGHVLAETNPEEVEKAIKDAIDNPTSTHKMSVDAQQVARFCYTLEENARTIHQLHKDFFANQRATA
ncbi:glycosyltransferase, partial [Slackia isoflavoniconvertens]|uniref:glycosyltransferase n=1 Tax=Slackia isoflavoniconvertens TaxID=572010 RepID=UPI003AEF68DF